MSTPTSVYSLNLPVVCVFTTGLAADCPIHYVVTMPLAINRGIERRRRLSSGSNGSKEVPAI